MSKSPSPQAGTPWMPVTAGTLSIIVGAVQVLIGLLIIGLGAELSERGFEGLGVIGLPFVILGIVAIVGGIFAAVRKAWPLALSGAIAGAVSPVVYTSLLIFGEPGRGGTLALMVVLLLAGVFAIALTALGRRDFK